MNQALFGLAVQGLLRKKRSSLLLFTVLLLSFAFAILSLTVTGSIRKTNEEYRYNTYGTWYGAIPNGQTEDEAFLRQQPWLGELGVTKGYGAIQASTSGSTGIGVMDEALLRLGRIGLQDGRLPENAGEIAMEADLLSALGYDYTLGQCITFTVEVPATAVVEKYGIEEPELQSITVPVEQTYILCGVLREYADLWVRGKSFYSMPPLCSALITPGAAGELWQVALKGAGALQDDMAAAMNGEGEVTHVTLNDITPQYYFSVLPGTENEMKEAVNGYLKSTRDTNSDATVKINTAAFVEEESSIEGFFAGLILTVTLLAVVCIYAIRIQDEARQLAIFRSIGITKRQLCVMLLYETLCIGVPAMMLGIGAGALGVWALLRLAVYSGSAPIRVVIPPALLAAAAVLWLLGVVAARIGVFLVALRAPLTGRFHMARNKARQYRRVQHLLVAGLSALLCAALVFTVVELLEPLHRIRYMNTLYDYKVTRKENDYLPGSIVYFSNNQDRYEYLYTDLTVSKEAAAPISRVPGVRHAWGWGEEYVRLRFDGMENVPLIAGLREEWERIGPGSAKGELPYGIGPYEADALPVYLVVVDEGDWAGVIDFDIDMEKFRTGDAVLMAFRLGTDGKFISSAFFGSSMKGYGETGLAVGDTIGITAGTPKVYATVQTQVGGILCYSPDADMGGLHGLTYSYTVICSEAFLQKLLDAIGPGEAWNEFRQGTPYGYAQVDVFVHQNAEYLSTDTVLAELCARENLKLNAEMRAVKHTALQQNTQTLILLVSGGGCVTLVLLLILGNTLAMEAQRQKRSLGILQALGMSKRQLRRRQLGTALGRSVLAAAIGWLAYGGYCVLYALREQARRLAELGTAPILSRILKEKFSSIIRYWGTWQIILPLSAVCLGLILAVSWLADRQLLRQDLMAKLRDEH